MHLFTQARLGLSARLARIRFHVRPKQDSAGITNERRHETRLLAGPPPRWGSNITNGAITVGSRFETVTPQASARACDTTWGDILLAVLPKTRAGSGAASGWVCYEYNFSLLYLCMVGFRSSRSCSVPEYPVTWDHLPLTKRRVSLIASVHHRLLLGRCLCVT